MRVVGFDMQDAGSVIDRFAGLQVLVVGDAVLDVWLYGKAARMSREGPVPVVDIRRREPAPGGAANCAGNAATLRASVRYLGVVGDDEAGRELGGLLAKDGVDVSGLLVAPRAATTVKQRLVSDGQVLARFDSPGGGWPADLLDELDRALGRFAPEADLVVLADYGGGVVRGTTRDVLAGIRERVHAPVVVDGHDFAGWSRCAPTAMSPTADEALGLLGVGFRPGDRVRLLERHAAELLDATGTELLLTTLDADGTMLLRRGRPPHRTHTRPASAQHTCGAGDTFSTTFGLALAVGADPVDAAELAQRAAEVVVQRPGTCRCTAGQLKDRCVTSAGYLGRQVDELVERIGAHRDAGRRIVFTNGCFDVLHAGHAQYLHQAKALGDVLVAAVNSDHSVRRVKGPDRPLVPEDERAALVAALAPVDLVVLFDETTPRALIERVRPDIYVKGGDYSVDMLPEAEVLARIGAEIITVDYLADHSSSELVRRIRGTPASAVVSTEDRW
jgi:D-beta-D-heptose 7-phosphate kinase / D-beta-D-heptose 1-phosphate adenosyltransferase